MEKDVPMSRRFFTSEVPTYIMITSKITLEFSSISMGLEVVVNRRIVNVIVGSGGRWYWVLVADYSPISEKIEKEFTVACSRSSRSF